jgi:hypothetical protein
VKKLVIFSAVLAVELLCLVAMYLCGSTLLKHWRQRPTTQVIQSRQVSPQFHQAPLPITTLTANFGTGKVSGTNCSSPDIKGMVTIKGAVMITGMRIGPCTTTPPGGYSFQTWSGTAMSRPQLR